MIRFDYFIGFQYLNLLGLECSCEVMCLFLNCSVSDLPAFAVHNEVFTITYKIRNRTIYVQSFDSLLPSSSDFVFSGNRLVRNKHNLNFIVCI